MKIKLCIGSLLLAATLAGAQTNSLTDLLQQGLFAEQADRNFDAAIADYQKLATKFDQDRQLAATAIFRLGECYRAEGRTNEAASQYQRILREFSDQQTLATLSRQDLAGMGLAATQMSKADSALAENSSKQLFDKLENLRPDLLETVLPTMMPDAVLDQLLKQRDEAQAKFVTLTNDYALTNVVVTRVQSLLDELNRQIHERISGIMLGLKLRAEMPAPNVAEKSVQQQLEAAREKEAAAKEKEAAVRELESLEKSLNDKQKLVQTGQATRADTDAVEVQINRLRAQLANIDAQNQKLTTAAAPASSEEDQEIDHLRQLLQDSPDLINAAGNSSLPGAAAADHLRVAEFLLDNHADIEARDQVGKTALIAATENGHKSMVDLLLNHGADVNARRQGDGESALHIAANLGFQAVADVLLSHHADVNLADANGATPLFAAARAGQLKTVKKLLTAGASVGLKDQAGKSVLFSANGTDVFQTLLDAGADPNAEDHAGSTLLATVADSRQVPYLKLLLAAHADPNRGQDSPLLNAIHRNDLESAELLLQAGAKPNGKQAIQHQVDIDNSFYQKGSEFTPLQLAVGQKQTPMAKLLLKYHADPNGPANESSMVFEALSDTNLLEAVLAAGATVDVTSGSSEHWTPLAAAAWDDNAPAVAILLKHGANPNARNPSGLTPLHYASYPRPRSNGGAAETNVFVLLLAANANPNVRNDDSQTPLDVLKAWGDQHLSVEQASIVAADVKLLRDHGAVDNPPDLNRIILFNPQNHVTRTIFTRNKIDWNHYTLAEVLFYAQQTGRAFNFPDLSQITINRTVDGGSSVKRIHVDLLNATNGVDVDRDVPVEFGDLVEIPERQHTLAEAPGFLSLQQAQDIQRHLQAQAGHARLVVEGGDAIELSLRPLESVIGDALQFGPARAALTSRSDLAHIKVERKDAATGKTIEWIVDCSHHDNQSKPGLWLRDGDVIEVPLKSGPN